LAPLAESDFTSSGNGGRVAVIQSNETPVAIRSLGVSAVLHPGRSLTSSDWKSKKALQLLKFLIAKRGHPAPKELLTDLLWPNECPDTVAHRFSVALSTVRTARPRPKAFMQPLHLGGQGLSCAEPPEYFTRR